FGRSRAQVAKGCGGAGSAAHWTPSQTQEAARQPARTPHGALPILPTHAADHIKVGYSSNAVRMPQHFGPPELCCNGRPRSKFGGVISEWLTSVSTPAICGGRCEGAGCPGGCGSEADVLPAPALPSTDRGQRQFKAGSEHTAQIAQSTFYAS